MAVRLHVTFELTQQREAEWLAFWKSCSHPHARQHLSYAAVELGKGRTPLFIAGYVDDAMVCTGLFSIRPLFSGTRRSLEAQCLNGPVFDDVAYFQDYIQAAAEWCAAQGVGSIRIAPYWWFPEAAELEDLLRTLGFKPFYRREGARLNSGLVDLTCSQESMLTSYSKWTRRDITRLRKFSIDLRPASTFAEALPAFESLCALRRRRGLTAMSRREFEETFDILRDGEYGILFAAHCHGAFLGGLWLVRGPQIANTAGYAIEQEACKRVSNGLSIGPPLWWNGIQWAQTRCRIRHPCVRRRCLLSRLHPSCRRMVCRAGGGQHSYRSLLVVPGSSGAGRSSSDARFQALLPTRRSQTQLGLGGSHL